MSTFDYLSGAVCVNAAAPESWIDQYELPFWEDPNNEEWGGTLGRILYHESVHFWQFLSSAYLANLVAEEWVRLLEYEKTGQLSAASDKIHSYVKPREDLPFTNRELVEAWARYWDVHTRSPARIMQEEHIDPKRPGVWEIREPGSTSAIVAYTNDAFDLVMQIGPDCRVYGRPYRWLLEKFQAHSAFVAVLFPIITHAAFGSPDPVGVFCSSFELAWNNKAVRDGIDQRSGSVNLDWFSLWPVVLNRAVAPVLAERWLPVYTSGLDAIRRGPLQTHPIFREYLHKVKVRGFLGLYTPKPGGEGILDLQEAQALVGAPQVDSMIPFALPGQPFYRRMLGFIASPPLIKFNNFAWSSHRPVELKLMAAEEGTAFQDTFIQYSNELEARVNRFRAAEKAVSLGLPPDAFEETVGS
ncbi:MAG: hypothetical protein WBV94_32695 [Blastocatellia bacterium]